MSNVLVPVSDFAALITRLEALEAKVAERLVDGVYKYGPCLRCGYGPWDSSSSHEPRCCPRCHSAYWNTTPRRSFARTPDDPPHPRWDPKRRVKVRKRAVEPAVQTNVVEAPTASAPRPAVVLPPELRPPGEPLIPPPPRLIITDEQVRLVEEVSKKMDASMDALQALVATPPAPTAHVAPLPDAVVEAVLAGESVTHEDLKAAKETGDADARVSSSGSGEASAGVHSDVREVSGQSDVRRTDPSLQAKKDAFFADAIAAGLISPVVEGAPDAPATPFVTDSDAPSLAPKPDDDPFWK